MRLHARFPLQFWEDAMDIFVYLINKGPSSSLNGDILEEACIGKKVNYSFLKTFNCEAFVHIDKENKTKLEENPRSVILLDMELMILVIVCMIMKTIKLLEV